MNHLTHTTEQRKQHFLDLSKQVHGDKYDYSQVIYTKAQDKVKILCPIHGEFTQTPDSHRNGRGCPKCGIEKFKATNSSLGFSTRKTQDQFLEDARKVHGNTYTYSKVLYTGKANKITITCTSHGDFSQKAENHLNGAGCPKCGISKAHTHFLQTTSDFIKKSKQAHGDKYDYSLSNYIGKDKPIIVSCKEHGPYPLVKAWHHYLGHKVGCPKCSMSGVSKSEQEIYDFVKSQVPSLTVVQGSRKIIAPLELDIVVEELKLAVEFNGLYWHSEQAGKSSTYHLNKTLKAKEAGYTLIHIFEDEWSSNQDVVKSRLRHLLGITTEIYYARKTEIRQVGKLEANEFFSQTHIQGACGFSKGYGLYLNNVLVACMSFGVNRFTKNGEMELIRYSTKGSVVGGFSKLLKHYLKENPQITYLISYSDRRWSTGKVYSKNGFSYVSSSAPSYFYSNNEMKRINRVSCQKHKLPSLLGDENFNINQTEVQNMIANGYTRIFDCGTDKWIFKRDSN